MKKVIITIILSIVSITGIGGFKIVNNQSKKTSTNNIPEIQNEVATDENLINEEIIISLQDEENKTSTDEVTPPSELEQTNSENDKVVVPEKNETKKSTTSNSASSGKSNTSSNQNVNTKKSTTASTKTTASSNSDSTTKKETSTSSNKNTSPTPSTPKTTTPTKTKKIPVYCYEGGSKHLGGTGPYEHGYYNSYQQAWNALTVYMENMNSGNYYIEQCLECDKYYFYCKQD